MDIKTLTIGQVVCMQSGPHTQQGKVVKPEVWMAVDINNVTVVEVLEGKTKCLFMFGPDGKTGSAWDGLGSWDYIGNGWMMCDPRIPGTEFGPWKLVEDNLLRVYSRYLRYIMCVVVGRVRCVFCGE